MFLNQQSKEISTNLRMQYGKLRDDLNDAFENSILDCHREKDFFLNLIVNVSDFLNKIQIPNVAFNCRYKEIHSKPIVHSNFGNFELGDLLAVVKYQLSVDSFEAKSIIYQVKLARANSTTCIIDQDQLDLLCYWPDFNFGRSSDGAASQYNIVPQSIEFGSFMLELRNPSKDSFIKGRKNCYGVCPYALMVKEAGPTSIDIDQYIYSRGDASNFFSHLAFEIGEHHSNQNVRDLVDALYRYVGLSKDPPGEFDDYSIKSEDDGFAIIEITVKPKLRV